MQERWDHFIDGHAVPPKSARYLDDHDPATGEKIAEVARGDAADVDAADAAGPGAFAGGGARRPIERRPMLLHDQRKGLGQSVRDPAVKRRATGGTAVPRA